MLAFQDRMIAEKGSPNKSKNLLINSDFRIVQRSSAVNNYTFDRWLASHGLNGAFTPSRIFFTIGQTDVPNEPFFYYRHQQTTPASGGQPPRLMQLIELVRTLAGETCVLSFWARADANRTISLVLRQHFGTGGSASANVETPIRTVNLTTTWQRFQAVFNVPSLTGKVLGSSGAHHLGVRWLFPQNATFSIDIARPQLERGNFATDFKIADHGETEMQCQRYYQDVIVTASGSSTAGANEQAFYSTIMRGVPTLTGSNLSSTNTSTTPSLSIQYSNMVGGMTVADTRSVSATGAFSFQTRVSLDAELLEA